MNKIIVILIISLLMFSCKKGANINVSIKDVPNGRKVTLKKQVDRKIINIDSTTVQNEKFSFNYKISEPMVVGIFIDSLKQGIFPLMDVNDNISVIAYKDSLHFSKVTGSKLYTDLTNLRQMKTNLSKKMNAFAKDFQEARKVNDTAKISKIQKDAKLIQDEISANEWAYIKENPNSHVSAMVLTGLLRNPLYKDSIKPTFNAFSDQVKNSEIAKQLKTYLEKQDKPKPTPKVEVKKPSKK